jgi:hypothetical protein
MKLAGLDKSQLRVPHANERFGAAQIEGLAAKLGLVPQFEPASAQRLRDIDCASGRVGAPIIGHIGAGHIGAPVGACPGDRFRPVVVFREQGEVTAAAGLRIDAACERDRYLLQLAEHHANSGHLGVRRVIGRIVRRQVRDAKVVK